MTKTSLKSLGIGCVMAVTAGVTGCAADSDASLAPCPTTVVAKPSTTVETTGTCLAADVEAATELRAHVTQTTSVAVLASTLFSDTLVTSIVGTALDPIGLGSADDAFEHTFDTKTGEYVISAAKAPAQAELRFRLYWGEEHSRAGQPLMADAFTPDSYLVDPKLEVDVLSARVSVGYESAGPLVSIFGWGDTPKNPAVVRVSDADDVQSNVRGLMADARIIIRVGETQLELATAKKSLEEWIASPDPELHVVSGTTGSALTITEWPRNGTDGQVRFQGTAGAKGELTLRQGAVASAKLTCR